MEKGICPVCNGTKRRPCPDDLRKYAAPYGWYGYNKEDDTVDCDNCGKQYMMGAATGQVPLRPDGTPCVHEYKGTATRYRCVTEYTCIHCGDKHEIDSSD